MTAAVLHGRAAPNADFADGEKVIRSSNCGGCKAPFDFEGQDISVSKLLLDPNNYRFLDRKKFKKKAANRSHEESVQRATLESLEQSYQLDELKHSIITNGYVPMERIIVDDKHRRPKIGGANLWSSSISVADLPKRFRFGE